MGIFSNVKESLYRNSRELSDKLAQHRRNQLGQELSDKERALHDLEKKLELREKQISTLEKKIDRYYLIPRIYIQLPVIVALCIGTIFAYREFAPSSPTTGTSALTGTSSGTGSASGNPRRTQRETEIYGIFNDIDPKHGDFDVGGYCLDREKKGIVTFEECLGIAASKLVAE